VVSVRALSDSSAVHRRTTHLWLSMLNCLLQGF